jgi:cell division septation protein DedD
VSDALKAKMQARAVRIADRTFEQLRRQTAQLDAAETNTAVWLPVGEIRLDGGTQPRARLNEKVIAEYAEDMREGAEFPPVDVFYDGEVYWLADGYHRVSAAIEAGLTEVAATVHQGTLRDAVLFSVGVNAEHGVRRTNEDKRRAVTRLLTDSEWGQWSDNEIARRCHVHHDMVGSLRASLADSASEAQQRTYTTKHGTTATMNTSRIGHGSKKRAPSKPPVRSFTPDDVDQTPPEDDAYQDVTAGMQPESTEPTAQASGLSREEYALMIATYTRLQKAVLDAQDTLALIEQVQGIRAFFALGQERLQQLHDLLGNLQAQLYPTDQHLNALRKRIVHMIVTGEPYD